MNRYQPPDAITPLLIARDGVMLARTRPQILCFGTIILCFFFLIRVALHAAVFRVQIHLLREVGEVESSRRHLNGAEEVGGNSKNWAAYDILGVHAIDRWSRFRACSRHGSAWESWPSRPERLE